MDTSSFLLNRDLAGFIITIAAQSILISLFGIVIIKLLRKKSAPVRSLVGTCVICILGLAIIASAGFRLSGISWSTTLNTAINDVPVFDFRLKPSKISRSITETGLKPVSTWSESDDEPVSMPSSLQSSEISRSITETGLIRLRLQAMERQEPVSTWEEPDNDPVSTKLVDSYGMAPDSAAPVIKSGSIESYLSIELVPILISLINFIGFIWLIGILFHTIRLGYGSAQVVKFRKTLRPASNPFYREMARITSGIFWKNRTPALYISQDIESPLAIGLFNPVIVIPEKLFDSLNENELKSILLHELAHLYHYDQFMGIIKRIVLAFHWWNPMVYRLNRIHEQTREEISDNYVLRDIPPRIYTICLVNLAEKLCLISNLPTASCMAGKGFNLRSRVENILSKKRRVVMETKLYLKAAAVSIGFILTFGVAGLHGKVQSNTDNLETTSNLTPISQIADKKISSKNKIEKPEQIDITAVTDLVMSSHKAVHFETQTKNETPLIVSSNAGASIEKSIGLQTISGKSIAVQEAVDKPDKLQSIPKPVTMPQKKLSVKHAQEKEKPVMVMASVDMKAINKIEKPMNSVSVQSSGKPVLLTQDKTGEKHDSKSNDVPDNGALNNRPEEAANESKKEDIDTAIADLSRQIELNDSDAGLYMLRGNLHMDKQDYEQAVNDYTKAIEINPDDAAAYNNRGQAYVNMWEEYNNRRQEYMYMKEYNNWYNGLRPGYTYMVEIKQTVKDDKQADKYYKKAIKDFKKAIKTDPENIYAYINRGNAYCARQSYRKAISDYTRAIKIDPEVTLAYINRGIAYLRKSSFSNAVKDFSKALELDVKDTGTYLLRGNAYYSKRKYRQAIYDYSKALEINPALISAYNNCGMAYEGMGELDKAILEYSKAIDIISENPDAFINPDIFSKEEQDSNTVIIYRENSIYHNSFSNNYIATDIYSSMIPKMRWNRYRYSYRYYYPGTYTIIPGGLLSNYIFIEPLESYINRGLAYEKKNQLDKAISDFSGVIEINPNNALAYKYRSEVYRKMGNEAEYKNDLNMAKKYGYKSNLAKSASPNPKGYWEGSPDDYYYQITKDQYLDDPDKARWQNDWMQYMIRTQKNNSRSK